MDGASENQDVSARSGPAGRLPAKFLYFRRFLANPGRLASLMPSSEALSRLIVDNVRRSDDEFVVELGAGTGAITGALLRAGIPPDKVIAVESDGHMARYLRRSFPEITVVEGDALDMQAHLPREVAGKVGTVICGIPASLLSGDEQRALAETMFSLMPPGRRFLAYSFKIGSPFRQKKTGLVGRRLAFTLRNSPPASVWAYEPNGLR